MSLKVSLRSLGTVLVLSPLLVGSDDPDLCPEHRWDLAYVTTARNTGRIDERFPTPEVLRIVESTIPDEAPDGRGGCGTYRCAGRIVTEVYVRNSLAVGSFQPPCEQLGQSFIAGVDVGDGVHVFTFDWPWSDEGLRCYQGIDGVTGDRTPVTNFELADIPREVR